MIFGRSDNASLLCATFPTLDATRAAGEAAFMERSGIRLLCRREGTLPARLESCPDAPRGLFVSGDCDLSALHSIAIVGTRRATAAGIEFCRKFVSDIADLCNDTLIISGLAYGIDVAAHRAALDCGLPTAAVVAHGLDTVYPADHRDIARRIVMSGKGALVSEYMSGARVHKSNFLARNRIVAALAAAVIVVESASHGGALYTARVAAEYGRPVFAVPGRWNDRASEGCNRLIADGRAKLLTDAASFAKSMCWETSGTAKQAQAPELDFTQLTGNTRIIADYLRTHPGVSRDDLTLGTGLAPGEVGARLMEMELDDLLSVLPGGHFQLNF